MLKIISAESQPSVNQVRLLFEEYAAEWPGPDLDAENFAEELTHLPGIYAPPHGRLLIALFDKQSAGCIALRKLSDEICEVKRLYVKPEFRNMGIGRRLVEAVLEEAREIGFARVHLDTIEAMEKARALYRSFGFREIEPYNDKKSGNAVFMALLLPRE
jgi:carbonic anhydrase